MNHEPFETWILSQKEEILTPQQQNELQVHLDECPHCRQIAAGWANVESIIQSTPMVCAPTGFAQRAQTSLAKRRQREHQLQTRRFFLFTFVFLVVTSLILSTGLLIFLSPVGILVNVMHMVARCALFFQQVENVLRVAASAMPPIIPVMLIVLAISTFTILSLVWSMALWRISVKGVLR